MNISNLCVVYQKEVLTGPYIYGDPQVQLQEQWDAQFLISLTVCYPSHVNFCMFSPLEMSKKSGQKTYMQGGHFLQKISERFQSYFSFEWRYCWIIAWK